MPANPKDAKLPKQYDRAYYDHWYRRAGLDDPARLRRKIALAISVAEYHLGRPVRSVLDIGAGEAAWHAPLRRLRPGLSYQAFDNSEYAVRRFGRTRNIALASFRDFAQLRPCAPADLVVCSDVLHYLPTREIDRGLEGIAALCGGVAFLETWTARDAIEGDRDGFFRRSAAFYRKRFASVGLVDLGNHCWLSPGLAASASELEIIPSA